VGGGEFCPLHAERISLAPQRLLRLHTRLVISGGRFVIYQQPLSLRVDRRSDPFRRRNLKALPNPPANNIHSNT